MFGEYSYNKIIRNVTAVFGTLFNDIWVARELSDGTFTNQKRVPIAYGPRIAFLDRIAEQSDLFEDRVAISLPRLSYEISGSLVYDPDKQISRNQTCRRENSEGQIVKILAPVPYRIPYELNVLTKTQDDALQIVEQILPHFKPSLGVKVRPIRGEEFTDEINFVLNSVTSSIQYEGDISDGRTIIYTLSFDAEVNIYGPITTGNTIKSAIVNFSVDTEADDIGSVIHSVVPSTAEETDEHEIVITEDFGFA